MSPAHKRWTVEHQRLLGQARVNAGINDAALARDSTMTLRQLQQLEQGGSSAFYSESIQYDMGMKLLRRLNVSDPVLASLPAAATRATVGAALPYAPQSVAPPPAAPASGRPTPKMFPVLPPSSGRPVHLAWMVIGVGLLGAGLLMSWWPPDLERVSAAAVVAENQQSHPAGGSALPAAPTDTLPGTPERAVPTVASVQAEEVVCGLGPQALRLSPDHPAKASDYVYLVASATVVVCVQDAQGQKTRMTLQAGRKLNVPGRPPFDLTADAMSHLQVFFQGRRMTWPMGTEGIRLQPGDTRP